MVTDSDNVGNDSIRGNIPYEEGVRLTSDRQHRSSLGGGRGAGQWEFNHRRNRPSKAQGSISRHFKKLFKPNSTEQYSRVNPIPSDTACELCDSSTLAFRRQGRKLFELKHIISISFAFVTIFISACQAPAILVFVMNLIAIVPLSITLTLATEQLSHDLGETTGALLNITIGNLAELIIFATALMKDNIKVVQASLLGSILVNLLLVLGSAIIAGGIISPDQTYNNDLTQSYVGLLNLTVACLMIPTAFYGSVKSVKSADHMSLAFSRGVSVILLIIYFLYLFFQFNTHKHLFRPRAAGIQVKDLTHGRGPSRASFDELFDIESHIDGNESTAGESTRQPEMQEVSSQFSNPSPADIRPQSGLPLLNPTERDTQDPHLLKAQEHRCRNNIFASRIVALTLLVASTVLIAICAEFFASSFDVLNEKGVLGESFVGLIVIPVAGNVAENVTAVMVAAKDQMDLAISVALGSAIQIGLLVAPVIVLVAWGLGKPMTLHFDYFGLITLVGSGILVSFLVLKGKTNYLEGAILCASFAAISVGAFLLPIH